VRDISFFVLGDGKFDLHPFLESECFYEIKTTALLVSRHLERRKKSGVL
jgi:hypothetical protein